MFLKRKATWHLLLKKKMLTAALAILTVNLFVALFAAYLTPYDPVRDLQVADDFALPEWATTLMGLRDLPKNFLRKVEVQDWTYQAADDRARGLEVTRKESHILVVYSRTGKEEVGETRASFRHPFEYSSTPPKTFVVRVPMNVTALEGENVAYRAVVSLVRDTDKTTYPLYDSYPPWRTISFSRWAESELVLHSRDTSIARRLGISPLERNVAETIFSRKGSYELVIELFFQDFGRSGESGRLECSIGIPSVRILGLQHGFLGTNHLGADVFSQLVYGVRVSLIVGFLAAGIAVCLGLVVGVIAGYKGGFTDQASMFSADTFMQTPVLPIILLVMLVFGRNIYIIIAIIALMSWMGLARQLRAWVLSLKERAFVEAARAIGASDFYVMFKVIAPQTTPLLVYSFVLSIPGAIMLEAALSLIGFGDPFLPSWGKMINEAWNGGAFSKLAWWWVAPPIVAILLLALSFVFIGYGLEETLQPALKRRQ